MKAIEFKPRNRRETATPPDFQAADILIICEALRLSIHTLNEAARLNDVVWPGGKNAEHIRMAAEQMQDLRERMEVA